MKKIFYFVAIISGLFLSSCGSNETSHLNAIGGKVYGGEFKFMSSEKVENLLTISSIDIYAQRLNSQIFESLVKLDIESLNVVPCIAESYEVSDDAKSFTFKIRKGIHFHDDDCFGGEGREVTAEDVKFTLEMACSGLKINKMSYLLVDRIEGARDFFNRSKKSLPKEGVSGIQVIDKQTIQIHLNDPFIGFDKILSHTNLGIFPKEAFEMYGAELGKHPVGTGPFMLEKMDAEGVTLTRNPKYWRKDEFGNQLPFLDKILMSCVKDKKSELIAFRNRQIDVVLEIPVDEIDNILGSLQDAQAGKNVKHRVESKSSMSMNYVGFACESAEFRDMNVRKAFNKAIDRKIIVNQLLKGEGWAAENGFVPVMANYQNETVIGHKYDVAEARALLAAAGYPDGKGFPKLDFYVNSVEGSSIHKMCQGVAQQIKENLNIDLNIKLCSYEQRNKAIANGKAKIWRSGWIADYPDAESFLSLFYSKNIKQDGAEVNAFKFIDNNYDQLFEIAMKELDETKRNELFALCDQIIIDKAPVIPVLTDDFMAMVNARVRDFKTNSMETLDFSSIFIKEPKK
ncbi:MAG: ABC transporter substrate-binding protein [Flavobacteriia bacterium]|jgi:peptide/nickel transport system substrate-binding protein